jgi:hypothetical protein
MELGAFSVSLAVNDIEASKPVMDSALSRGEASLRAMLHVHPKGT